MVFFVISYLMCLVFCCVFWGIMLWDFNSLSPEICGCNSRSVIFKTILRIDVMSMCHEHDDVIKWKHFPCYWPFVWGIHRSPVNSPHKGQWRGALMFPLICVWINGWVNNREAGDLRRYHAHYDVTVMKLISIECHRTHWWWVIIGSGNGLVPSGNVDLDVCHHTTSQGHNV